MISDRGVELIKLSEGFEPNAYPDPATHAEPYTIGYGRAHGVHLGDTCTEAQAEQWLLEDLAESERIIDQWVQIGLTEGQRAACASFIYNIGPGAKGSRDGFVWLKNGNHSTLLRSLNDNDIPLASSQFPLWANPPLPGLVTRRHRERQLFDTGDWTP